MNEQLQTALAEMLGKANAGIDAGATFLQAQLPDVIQQLLLWKATFSALQCAIGALLLIGAAVSLRVYRRKRVPGAEGQKYGAYQATFVFDDDGNPLPTILPLIVAQVASLIIGLVLLNATWLQIWLAPKIYLIEYAASLAK